MKTHLFVLLCIDERSCMIIDWLKSGFFLMNITFLPINRRHCSRTRIQFAFPVVFPSGVLGVNSSEPVCSVVEGVLHQQSVMSGKIKAMGFRFKKDRLKVSKWGDYSKTRMSMAVINGKDSDGIFCHFIRFPQSAFGPLITVFIFSIVSLLMLFPISMGDVTFSSTA